MSAKIVYGYGFFLYEYTCVAVCNCGTVEKKPYTLSSNCISGIPWFSPHSN